MLRKRSWVLQGWMKLFNAPDQNLTWNSVQIFIKASKRDLTLSGGCK